LGFAQPLTRSRREEIFRPGLLVASSSSGIAEFMAAFKERTPYLPQLIGRSLDRSISDL